jgi:predicted small integral membrane protein
VLRIFGPKRDEVTGEWRKLHNEELHDLYFSSSIIRIIKSMRMRWAGHVARMGEKRNAYRPLETRRRGWVDNIRMDLVEMGWSDVDWIGLAQDRNRWRALVNSVLNLRVP